MARIATGAALLLLSLVVRAAPVDIVEFYNPDLDHYFITMEGGEATIVDSGVVGRWFRTGEYFEGWATQAEAPAGAIPVYRFYAFTQNSHFYTSSATEKDYLVSLNPYADRDKGWLLEGIAFYIAGAPTAAAKASCSGQMRTVQRAYNNGFGRNGSNHRYFMNPEVGEAMRLKGWTPEGAVICYKSTSRLRVQPKPITCGVGESCNGVIATAIGGGTGAFGTAVPYVFTAPAAIAGLAVNSSSTGVSVAGVPATAGVFQAQVSVRDNVGGLASAMATVRIEAAPSLWLQTAGLVSCSQGEACNILRVAQASGGRGSPFAFQATGLPAGLALQGDATFANLFGTPTQQGVFNAVVTAVDRLGVERANQALVVSVSAALTLVTTNGNCVVNQPCSIAIAAAAGGNQGFPGESPYSFYHDPATSLPPPGMIIGQSDGVLSGTPSVAGAYTFGVCAYDRANRFRCSPVTVAVAGDAPPPTTPTGTIKWTIGDQCNNGARVDYKFYDRANGWVWPSATSHYYISYNQSNSHTLGCFTGSQVCLGASSGSSSWGVGFGGGGGCSNCCGTCDGRTYSYSFGCASSPPPSGGPSYYANWSCGSSSQCAAAMGGSAGSKGPFCSVSSCQAWGGTYIPAGYSCSTQPTYTPDPGGSQCYNFP